MFKYRSAWAVSISALAFLGLLLSDASGQSRTPRGVVQDAQRSTQSPWTVVPAEDPIVVLDMEKLGIRPAAERMAPDSAGVAPGGAQMSISADVTPVNSRVACVGSGFDAGEVVHIFIDGTLASNTTASSLGTVSFFVSTGPDPGYLLIELQGATNGKRVGVVTKTSLTGPFVSGIAISPHAINSGGAVPVLTFAGTRFPANSTLTVKRNGVVMGSLPSSAGDVRFTLSTGGDHGLTAAVYTVEVEGVAATMAGVSIEERSDAGVLPGADQTVSRAFVNRAAFNNSFGGSAAFVGEGFIPGENVSNSCSGGSVAADANGTVSGILTMPGPVAPGGVICTLGAAGSFRVARFALWFDPQVFPSRAIIVAPAYALRGGTVKVLATGLPANDTGTIFVDGVAAGAAMTDAAGNGIVTIPKPASGFLHAVVWVTSTGVDTAAALMMGTLTAGEVSLSGRVKSAEGRGITNARVTVTGPTLAEPRSVITDRRGEYSVEGLPAGSTYVVSVAARRFTFNDATRVVTINDNLTGVDFTAVGNNGMSDR